MNSSTGVLLVAGLPVALLVPGGSSGPHLHMTMAPLHSALLDILLVCQCSQYLLNAQTDVNNRNA